MAQDSELRKPGGADHEAQREAAQLAGGLCERSHCRQFGQVVIHPLNSPDGGPEGGYDFNPAHPAVEPLASFISGLVRRTELALRRP